jgi:hypothetical protein
MRKFGYPFVHGSVVVLVGFSLLAHGLTALAEDEEARTPKLFESDDILALTISAPWRELERKRQYQGTYPATLEYQDHTGKQVTLDLTVERRGVKRQETCRVPPIRLRFEKEAVKGTIFRGETSLKMVTHCQDSDRYDQYYLLEMMAYRMYNRVTDYSFRVQPLSVSYKDSEKGDIEADRFAFVIEDDSDVAKRNGLKKLEVPKVFTHWQDSAATSDFSLFQYMISNLDWSALRGPEGEDCCHNVKLIAPRPFETGDKAIPVPYDFDASGIVNTPYAAPPEGLGVNSVTQPLYRGFCAHNDTLEASRQKYLSLENDIMAVLDSDARLSERSKKKAVRMLERYFDVLKDDKDFNRQVIEKCRS